MGNTIKPGTSNSHDKTQTTGITVSAYYKVYPEDRQIFIDAVIPEMIAANKIEGCIYYAFSQYLTDENTFHLLEGLIDEPSCIPPAFHQLR